MDFDNIISFTPEVRAFNLILFFFKKKSKVMLNYIN